MTFSKCKIRFIYVGLIEKKKSGVKTYLEIFCHYNVNSAPELRNDQKLSKKRISQPQFTQFFVWVWYILDASRWILTSRRFRICVAKGGRGCFRLSYRRPKLTLFSKKKSTKMSRCQKFPRPQFSKYRFQIESAWTHSLWAHADSIWKWYFENCGRAYFF